MVHVIRLIVFCEYGFTVLPADALSQYLPLYLSFSYLGRGESLHGSSSKVQPLLLTLDEGCLLTATFPDLQCGMAPLGPPAFSQPPLIGHGVAPPGHRPWPQTRGISSRPSCDRAATTPWTWVAAGRGNCNSIL